MNSFIGWIGGKRALRNEILQRMPADIGRYIEVFGGAGWVLFGREPSSKVMEVFNDYDAELVNIYRCIKYHPDALQHELDMLPDAREVFFDCLAQEQVRGLTDIQRAARSLYLIKASFGTDRRTFATAPKGVRNISASFPAVQERLRRVIIENLDFEHLIKTYDRETPYSTAILRMLKPKNTTAHGFKKATISGWPMRCTTSRAASCCPTMIAHRCGSCMPTALLSLFRGVIRCLRKVWTATKKSLFATMNYNGKRYILPK